jgi:ankyrin
MAQEIYNEAIAVPFMAKFVVFARRPFPTEGQLRMFCMTDDKEEKTLEKQEGFMEIAKSRDVEVLGGRHQWLEFAGNLVPVTKRGDQVRLPHSNLFMRLISNFSVGHFLPTIPRESFGI